MGRWRPSKTAAREFAAKMQEIEDFCSAHGITMSSHRNSYYFEIRGQKYRVSNHSVETSNAGAYDWIGAKTRDLYHPCGREPDVIYIHAGKTRIVEIYNLLAAGVELDGRGNPV